MGTILRMSFSILANIELDHMRSLKKAKIDIDLKLLHKGILLFIFLAIINDKA